MAAPPQFDWDEQNQQHLTRHQISRSEAEDVLSGNHVLMGFDVVDGEERWIAVGATRAARILIIVFAIREEAIRPITGWQADKETETLYLNEWGIT